MQLIIELGTRVGPFGELNGEVGNVVGASAEIREPLAMIEGWLEADVIAFTSTVVSSAMNMSTLFPSVIGIAEGDREPPTTMRTPRKDHRA
jgi:hypothetical protein